MPNTAPVGPNKNLHLLLVAVKIQISLLLLSRLFFPPVYRLHSLKCLQICSDLIYRNISGNQLIKFAANMGL